MNPYYIYALKDPRTSPARPFYIGKGTGSRAWEHTLNIDSTRKGRRIAEIQGAGKKVVTTVLANELTEALALKLEAELISAFGTEDTGGLLTNSVIPSGAVVTTLFKFVRQFFAARFHYTTIVQYMHKVRHNIVEQSLVVSNNNACIVFGFQLVHTICNYA